MTLSGKHFRLLHEALVAAFPNRQSLAQMLRFNLSRNLDEIAPNGNLRDTIFALIQTADSAGWVAQLLDAARKDNQGNVLLANCAQQLQPFLRPASAAGLELHLGKASFDLIEIVRRCTSHLIDQSGLIGIALDCDEDDFRVSFCERLQIKLGRRMTQIRPPRALTPRIPPAQLIRDLAPIARQLQTNNVVQPIPLRNYYELELRNTAVNEFWQALGTTFGHVARRLIVVFFSDEQCDYPVEVFRPGAPHFHEVDAFDWTLAIVEQQAWPEDVHMRWYGLLLHECRVGVMLDVGRVYLHLEDSLRILQHHPSADVFLSELERRLQV